MRIQTLVLFSALAVLAAAPATADGVRDSLLVSPAWLAEHLKDADLVLLHVGDKKEYDDAHIPGARYVSLRDISISDHSGNGLMLEILPAPAQR